MLRNCAPFVVARTAATIGFGSVMLFASHRTGLPPDLWSLIPRLPETLTCYGWTLQPDSWIEWHTLLCQPAPCPSFATPLATVDQWIDLFTDGSCLWPKHEYSLASWAAVQATSSGSPLAQHKSHVIAAGHVEGLAQIAYRAELTGVCEAIRFGPVALCASGVIFKGLSTD